MLGELKKKKKEKKMMMCVHAAHVACFGLFSRPQRPFSLPPAPFLPFTSRAERGSTVRSERTDWSGTAVRGSLYLPLYQSAQHRSPAARCLGLSHPPTSRAPLGRFSSPPVKSPCPIRQQVRDSQETPHENSLLSERRRVK